MNNEIIKIKINEHDKKIWELDKRLDKNDRENAEFKIQIKHLIDNIESLTVTMRWFIGLMGTSLVGFFFYAIQNGLFN